MCDFSLRFYCILAVFLLVLTMSRKGTDFLKRLIFFARKYSERTNQNFGKKMTPLLKYFGVFAVSSGSFLYLCEKYGLIRPSLASEEEHKRKKIVVLGSGWAAVNFLRYVWHLQNNVFDSVKVSTLQMCKQSLRN